MFRRWIAGFAAAAIVVAACGGDDDDGDADGTEPVAAATTAPDATEGGASSTSADGAGDTEGAGASTGSAVDAGADEPAPRRGGTLRYAEPYDPSRFDPHRSTIGQDIRLLAPVYDRLVHFDGEGNLVPGLATSWSFDETGTEFTMELREGVTFHDGAPFDSAAVKANIERGQTVEGSSIRADLAEITEVETPDASTVVLHLSTPNSMLPGMLSHRAGAMVSPTAFDNPDLDRAPVGAGPYRVLEYDVGSRIIMERFEDHWDTEAGGPDRIEYSIMLDSRTRLNALLAGQVDMTVLTGNERAEAEAAGFTTEGEPALTYLVLYLNRARSEFGDPLVRRAMNHAINRQAIIDAVLMGAGVPTVQPFPEGYFAHHPDYPADFYAYDPERARELLAEAGLPDGFQFEMLVPSNDLSQKLAEVVMEMLGEVGITAQPTAVEVAQTADVYYAQEQGDSLLAQWGGRPDPQMTLELQFTANGFGNPGDHTTPEFEAANLVTRAAVDPEERRQALQDQVAMVVEEAFQVPLVHDFGIYAYGDKITSFDTLVTGQADYLSISLAE
jgi:peptide/nickel transport system substrate-binding protein